MVCVPGCLTQLYAKSVTLGSKLIIQNLCFIVWKIRAITGSTPKSCWECGHKTWYLANSWLSFYVHVGRGGRRWRRKFRRDPILNDLECYTVELTFFLWTSDFMELIPNCASLGKLVSTMLEMCSWQAYQKGFLPSFLPFFILLLPFLLSFSSLDIRWQVSFANFSLLVAKSPTSCPSQKQIT